MIRDLTMMGEERPANVFDAARTRYELTVHQRLTRAMAMGGIATDEKPSQWMARFRQVGCSWDREDIELWALLGRLPPTLRTSLEHHTPQLSMEELLRKADSLYVTLPLTTIATITEVSAELAYAVQAGDLLAVNAILKGHWKRRYWQESEEGAGLLVPRKIRRRVSILQRASQPAVPFES